MVSASFVIDTTEIATQVVEAVAGLANVYNSFKLLKVSRGYYDLYKQQKEYYYNTFQAGLETPLAAEVYAIQRPTLDYARSVLTAYNPDTGPFGGKATDARGWWLRRAGAYNLGENRELARELETAIAKVQTDWTNYLFRFAESYYDLENDIRWRKRIALHNIGIKTGSAVSSALEGSLGEYQNHVNDFSNQLATYGNGIARYAGYKKGLADTSDAFGRGGYNTSRMAVPDYNYTRRVDANVGIA